MCNSIDRKAIGIWYDTYCRILDYKGKTFHKIINSKKGNKILTIEETVYALMRTNFLLINFRDKRPITILDLFRILMETASLKFLMRINVYLTLKKINTNPIVLQGPSMIYDHHDDELLSESIETHDKGNVIETCDLVKFYRKHIYHDILMLNDVDIDKDPCYRNEDIPIYITTPDSKVLYLLETNMEENKIIAITNIDSSYLLKITDLSLNPKFN